MNGKTFQIKKYKIVCSCCTFTSTAIESLWYATVSQNETNKNTNYKLDIWRLY